MSAEDSQDVIQALKAQQQVNGAATNGNGVHHDDDVDDVDGIGCSKSRKEEKEAISDLKEAVLADEAFSSENATLAEKVEAAVCALDEAVTAAEDAESKQQEAVSALEEALMTKDDAAAEVHEAASAVKEAAAKDEEAEAALDKAVLVMGEAVIKNLDRTVTAMDDAAPTPKPTPTVEVTPAPQQEEEQDDEEVAPVVAVAPQKVAEAPVAETTTPAAAATPDDESVSTVSDARRSGSWISMRQDSEERRREVEAQSRPTLNKAAMSTSIDEKSVRAAYEDVRSDTSDTEWAVFKFQDQRIVCEATGAGFDAFRGHFADNERGFGFIRFQMGDEMSKRQKFVFLTWVGPQVSVIRRAKMSIDKAMVKNIVKNFAVELQVESQSEINVESLRDQLTRVGGASY